MRPRRFPMLIPVSAGFNPPTAKLSREFKDTRVGQSEHLDFEEPSGGNRFDDVSVAIYDR